MNISFYNKTIIVTGGASGIGRASALQFLEAGGHVIVLDIHPAQANDGFEEFSDRLSFIKCDVSDNAQVQEAFRKIKLQFNKVDVLVNNAGIQTYGNAVNTDEALWDRTMNTNLKSAFLCSKHVIPLMADSVHPVIVNVGSAQGFVSQSNVTAYATSKEALQGLTRNIAINFAPHIRCLAICPGAVYTPMLENDIKEYDDVESILEETRNIHLLQRIAQAEEIANFITFLASDKASFATGHSYRVDGGIGLKIEGT